MDLQQPITENNSDQNKKEESLFCLTFSKTEGETERVKIEIEKYTQPPIQYVNIGLYKT